MVLKQAGKEGSMRLNNTVSPADEWGPVPHDQDGPPDSDDEGDVPLSVAPRTPQDGEDESAQAQPCAVVSAPGIRMAVEQPSIPLLPGGWSGTPVAIPVPRCSSVSTAMGLTPNPVGTRVPRPVPRTTTPKRPLMTQPIIWAKVRASLHARELSHHDLADNECSLGRRSVNRSTGLEATTLECIQTMTSSEDTFSVRSQQGE